MCHVERTNELTSFQLNISPVSSVTAAGCWTLCQVSSYSLTDNSVKETFIKMVLQRIGFPFLNVKWTHAKVALPAAGDNLFKAKKLVASKNHVKYIPGSLIARNY